MCVEHKEGVMAVEWTRSDLTLAAFFGTPSTLRRLHQRGNRFGAEMIFCGWIEGRAG